jgi:CRP-like cAMP-binding protein
LRFAHEEIAALCLATPEAAARLVTRLKNAGFIRPGRGMIQIKDPSELRLYGENINSQGLLEDFH